MHRPFAEVMIDAKDRAFIETAEQRAVERLRRRKVSAEGFFDNDASTLSTAQLRQMFDYSSEQKRWNSQIMGWALGPLQRLVKRLECCSVSIVTINVPQQPAQLVESRWIEPAVLLRRHAPVPATVQDSSRIWLHRRPVHSDAHA
jgi:hypothetical protein